MVTKTVKMLRLDLLIRERKGVKGKPRRVYQKTEYILYNSSVRTEGQMKTKVESLYPNWEVLAVDNVTKVSEVREMSEEEFVKYSHVKREENES